MAASANGEGINLGIIITPMLDMMFQIFFFFVMTYNPNALEGHIDGNLLPPTQTKEIKEAIAVKDKKEPKDKDKEDIPVDQLPPENTDTLTVIVRAVRPGEVVRKQGERDPEGQPKEIWLRKPESPREEAVADNVGNDFQPALDKLKNVLERIQKSPTGSTTAINIEPDPNLKHGYFVQVYDVCKAARFSNIGFSAPAKDSGSR